MKIIPCPTAPLSDAIWEPVEDDRIVSGKPERTFKVLHSSKSDEFHSGIYECTKGAWKVTYNEDEFCTLIEGHVRLTNDKGEAQDFKAPDSFIVPSGFTGTWEAVTPVRKFFVVYEKAAS
jgi:uncharacterized cupin superfamily protein